MTELLAVFCGRHQRGGPRLGHLERDSTGLWWCIAQPGYVGGERGVELSWQGGGDDWSPVPVVDTETARQPVVHAGVAGAYCSRHGAFWLSADELLTAIAEHRTTLHMHPYIDRASPGEMPLPPLPGD